MQMNEDKWQDLMVSRLITLETEILQTRCLLTALVNSLSDEQRKTISKEYSNAVYASHLRDKSNPAGLKY